MNIKEFLFQKFLEWQKESGQRRTVTEWAKYLGVPQASLSSWMSGSYLPKGANLSKLADKLGTEIYDVLGMTRPSTNTNDPDLQTILKDWSNLTPAERRTLAEQVNAMRAEKSKNTLGQ